MGVFALVGLLSVRLPSDNTDFQFLHFCIYTRFFSKVIQLFVFMTITNR